MRLYEITTEYRDLLDRYMDPDATQEELDSIAEQLAAMDDQWQDKARACYGYMREQELAADAIRDEIDRLTSLMTSHANAAKRIHRMLEGDMLRLELPKQDLGIVKMWVQNNPPRVVLDTEDVSEIDEQYIRVIPEKREVDKRAILDDLKAGAELPYAHLEQSQSLRFK